MPLVYKAEVKTTLIQINRRRARVQKRRPSSGKFRRHLREDGIGFWSGTAVFGHGDAEVGHAFYRILAGSFDDQVVTVLERFRHGLMLSHVRLIVVIVLAFVPFVMLMVKVVSGILSQRFKDKRFEHAASVDIEYGEIGGMPRVCKEQTAFVFDGYSDLHTDFLLFFIVYITHTEKQAFYLA
jgi:hypothetical protein